MYRPHLLRPASLNRRLWQAAGLLAVFVVTASLADAFFGGQARLGGEHLGHDFLAFYTAGTFVRTGNGQLLYDLPAVAAFQQKLAAAYALPIGEGLAAWWNPPFAALPLAPLSTLAWPWALGLWWLASAAALAGALVLMVRWLTNAADTAETGAGGAWRTWGPLPLLVILSVPCITALGHGQNTFFSLLLLAGATAAWRGNRPLLAGVICGALAYKLQLMLLAGVVLVALEGRRALAGLALTGCTMIALNVWLLPGTLAAWLAQVPRNLSLVQTAVAYDWDRHATILAFWRLLLQGFDAGAAGTQVLALTLAAVLALGGTLAAAVIRHRRDTTRDNPSDNPWTGDTAAVRRDRLITATLLVAPATSPFWFDYDLLLLAVPATLFAAEQLARAPGVALSTTDRWCRRLWVWTFAWLIVGPHVAAATLVHITPVLVASLAALHAKRACWPAATLPATDVARDRLGVNMPRERLAA